MRRITREEWLIGAIEALDKTVFDGDLDLLNHPFQINCGRCRGNKATETVQPSEAENITLDDFFPTTISVDWKIKDPKEILLNLAHECIKAFLGVTKGKAFAKMCEKYYFDKPYKEPRALPYLDDNLNEALDIVVQNYGEWPGKAVSFPKKDPKEKKSNKITFFCPECGWETYTTKSNMKNKAGTPTCICGTRMGQDLTDEQDEAKTDGQS